MSEEFTVIVRGEKFALSRDQVEFDYPNYFTSCFLGDFAESQTHTLRISRDPELFKIILDYLSGYRVLPLPESLTSRAAEYEKIIQNLRVDAEFYLLDGLVDQIKAYQEPQEPTNPSLPSPYVMLAKYKRDNTWSPPMFIAEDTADGMKNIYGIERIMAARWVIYEPSIQVKLQKAKIHSLFLVHALWEQTTLETDHVVLKLSS